MLSIYHEGMWETARKLILWATIFVGLTLMYFLSVDLQGRRGKLE